MTSESTPAPQDRIAERDELLELNFVPTWAREAPRANPYRDTAGDMSPDERPRGGKRERRGGPGGGRGRRNDRGRREAPVRERRPLRPFYPHKLRVSFLPDRKALGQLIHKIRATQKAYELSSIGGLLLSRPEFIQIKIESLPRSGQEPPAPLFQTTPDRALFLDRDAAVSHLIRNHLEHVFVREESEVEAPQGQFVCVARCTRSGTLLGPPNHHDYTDRIREIWRTRLSHMTYEEVLAGVETVHEQDLIEQWKSETTQQVRYRRKGADGEPEGEPMKWIDAEGVFLRECADTLIQESTRAVVPSKQIQESRIGFLRKRVEDQWAREAERPYTLSQALRPALRHMGMTFFRTQGSRQFVTGVAPNPVTPEKTVDSIRKTLEFLEKHPGCTRNDLLAELAGQDPSAETAREFLQPLHWLIDRGHVIEFFNDTLAVPSALRSSARAPAEPKAKKAQSESSQA